MTLQIQQAPAIHVREIEPGKMIARVMFHGDSAPSMEVVTTNFLTAARTLLATTWPSVSFDKTGWSANLSEAIYHFRSC